MKTNKDPHCAGRKASRPLLMGTLLFLAMTVMPVAADDPDPDDFSGVPIACSGLPGCDVVALSSEETEGEARCAWWNHWEADVEVLPEGEAAGQAALAYGGEAASALLAGPTAFHPPEVGEDEGDAWEVVGTLACGDDEGEDCSVNDTPDACGPMEENGKGDLKCDVTVRVGVVPQNWFVEITCKDPANPCAVVQTTLRSDPVTGEAIKDYHVPVCDW